MILDQSEKNCQQLNNCKLDNHWKPFISRCAYCDVRYSVIAKAETIEEDQKYIGHMANVTFQQTGNIGLCKLEMNWFLLEANKSSGGSTKELAKKYFSKLQINTVKQLYEFYKVDFEMFDYNPDEYLRL